MPATIIRHWTEDEERRLLELKEAGKSVRVIAKLFQRTEVAIENRLALLKANGAAYRSPSPREHSCGTDCPRLCT
jgi:hypothetical protein